MPASPYVPPYHAAGRVIHSALPSQQQKHATPLERASSVIGNGSLLRHRSMQPPPCYASRSATSVYCATRACSRHHGMPRGRPHQSTAPLERAAAAMVRLALGNSGLLRH